VQKFGVVNSENKQFNLSDPTSMNPKRIGPAVEEAEKLQETPVDPELQQVKDLLDNFEEKSLTPREMWEHECKNNQLTLSDAAKILDSVVTNGMYEEKYKVGRLTVTLRTRNTVDADRVIEAIQDFKPETSGALSHLVARMNLGASMSQFGDRRFNFTQPTDGNRDIVDAEFNERYRFCTNLPAQLFFTLTQLLEKFDRRVNLSCDPRGLENF
jgi:hypothetical protein